MTPEAAQDLQAYFGLFGDDDEDESEKESKNEMKLTESRLRSLIREELILEQDGSRHDDNLSSQTNLTLPQVEAGQFVSFPYTPSGDYESGYRFVFVVWNGRDKIHGINIDYLSELEMINFFAHIHAELGERGNDARKMMNTMFENSGILHAAHLAQPQSFYKNVIKKSDVKRPGDAYRTYSKSNIGEGLIERYQYESGFRGNINDYLKI